MTLEQIFYLSQSIASVAVVGSLIYLGLQVRSAERSQRAIMQQGRADRASNAALAIAHPELARVFQKGVAGDPTLTREELTQWMMMCRALFLSGEDSLLQVQGRAARSTRIRQLRCRCPLLDGINRDARRVETVGRTIRPRVSRIPRICPRTGPRGSRCGRLFRMAETFEIGIAGEWDLAQSERATAADSPEPGIWAWLLAQKLNRTAEPVRSAR